MTGPGAVTLLGPQRLTPTLPDVVRASGIDLDSSSCAPMATITAGWQEREDDDRDLVDALLGKTVNLRLYARANDIFERDTELAAAHAERGRRLRDLQNLYELRLAHAMDAVYELARHPSGGHVVDDEVSSALDAVRVLDQHLLDRSGEVVDEFVEQWRPAERDAVAAHRADVATILGESCGLAIAGGQVPTLLNRIHLLGVADHVAGLPVFAWSAGRWSSPSGSSCSTTTRRTDGPTPGCSSTGSAGCPAWWRCPTPAAAYTSTTSCASRSSPAGSRRPCASASTTEPPGLPHRRQCGAGDA
jgi:hypothetical protein